MNEKTPEDNSPSDQPTVASGDQHPRTRTDQAPPPVSRPAPAVSRPHRHRRAALPALVLGAIGVVFGDIGTSPLYALHTVFSTQHNAVRVDSTDVYGAISMVAWCLIIIVTIGYISLITRADNNGEGGILALAALIKRSLGTGTRRAGAAMILAIIGAALFYGDSLITPAISVLSAAEGLEVVNPDLGRYIVPVAVVVLAALFLAQRWGTHRIGAAFGPIMACWFVVLAVLGVPWIAQNPAIIGALNPVHAIGFALDRPVVAFVAMGAVVLAVTGAEALYADLGHFGRRPIVLAWLSLAFPALLLNYLGQGAMILDDPSTVANPFFHLAPGWATLPLVILATAATIIASQAVISGAFSVTRQATRLSLLPRLKVVQTSRAHGGQIYLPTVNVLLFIGVLTLVLVFGSSERLASAYGLAVTGTLLLELSLFLLLARSVWHWPLWRVIGLAVVIGGLEAVLFAANVIKIESGGWLPLVIAAGAVTVMLSWRRGSRILFGRRRDMEGPLDDFTRTLTDHPVTRVPGLAVFPHGDSTTVPLALRSNVSFNRVLHEHAVILTVVNVGVPTVSAEDRITLTPTTVPGLVQVGYRVGFNDSQDVPAALRLTAQQHPERGFVPEDASYMLSVFRIEPGRDRCMPRWQKRLFRVLEKFSANRTQVFNLPADRTVISGAETVL
ncbi:MAG: potassium transporter Kup [Mycetocola sp.]